jgi:hypothetical protein
VRNKRRPTTGWQTPAVDEAEEALDIERQKTAKMPRGRERENSRAEGKWSTFLNPEWRVMLHGPATSRAAGAHLDPLLRVMARFGRSMAPQQRVDVAEGVLQVMCALDHTSATEI